MKRCILALLLLLSTVGSADAQYFGRNKVQYDRRDLLILQTPHFDIYYDQTEHDAVEIAARMAERWYERLSARFDHKFARRQPIVLYGSHARFAQTSILPGTIGDGVGGFTDHVAGRVVLPFAAGLRDTDHVLGHELVHAFQRDILRQQGRSLASVPLWFSEGMAEYFSVGQLDANTRMWLRDAVTTGHLPTIAQLDDPRWFPYRYGQAFWQFVADTYGEAAIVKALETRSSSRGIGGRLQAATGKSSADLSTEWHAHVRSVAALPEPGARDALQPAVNAALNGGRLNVGPRLSPDGRYLVFLSERDRFSVDVFLADAHSGALLRKLVSTAVDAHSDSLQFIESAGAWSPSSRQFVYASVRDGRAVLTIVDVPSGEVRRELFVDTVEQILSPAWSPDGRRLAFSAMRGGLTDLYTVDLESAQVKALTSDAYSDLQPSWSPDGTEIVFASDRFSTSLASLMFGEYQLVTFDLQSGAMRLLTSMAAGKAIDPQWAPDGRTIYFVSDAAGSSNVYRLNVVTGGTDQLTRVATGVTGVTALSPSISVGDDGRRLAATLYKAGAYEIWTMPVATSPTSNAVDPEPLLARALAPFPLIPPDRPSSDAEPRPFGTRRYAPRLSLAQVGTPYLSAGGGAFGTFVRGGIGAGFSDLMGEQELAASVQVGKDSTDNAVIVSYANRRHRWNWGVNGGRIPALVGASDTLSFSTTPAGDRVLVQRTTLAQQVHHQAGAFASYPFSRAQRIEANAVVDAISFDQRDTVTPFSPDTRTRIGDPVTTHSSVPAARIVQVGTALVYDTAVFGPTSPVLGQRYRVGLAQTTGDVGVLTAMADYRKYVMPARSFTLAFRGMGTARLGPDVADSRLLPLVWNLRELVRGFDTDAQTIRTSRFVVGNVELRVPLTSPRSGGSGPLPVEGFTFADCGRFWTPEPTGLVSQSGCSAGGGARLNAAGFGFEFNIERRFLSARQQGWRFGVAFQPGF